MTKNLVIDATVGFMRDLEDRYRQASGLANRSQYRIFYGRARPADVLLLGINPGGSPEDVMPDGVGSRSGGKPHSAFAGYCENDESDLLDCDWPENRGLLKLLLPLMNDDRAAIRAKVVKTNLAFRRSSKVAHIDIEEAKRESAPFLQEIIDRVRPSLVLLAGVKLEDFADRFGTTFHVIGNPVRDDKVKQTVFRAARVALRTSDREVLAVQLAHASQFGWTYERYGVVERIQALWSSTPSARTSDVADEVAKPVVTPPITSRDSPVRPTGVACDPVDVGMNVAGYEALFRKLGFNGFESHKKLRHPWLAITLYFNRDSAGFVSFVVYAKDGAWFKSDLWEYIPARKVKDDKPGLRTVLPKAGREEEAFRDLLNR